MNKLYFTDFTIGDLLKILKEGCPIYIDWDKQYMIVDTDFIK